MLPFIRLLTLITILLALPLLTVSLWSGPLENWIESWQDTPPSAGWLATALVLVLAADILLPVPSGPLITLAGGHLGVPLTAMTAWLGLMLGSVAAFGITKRWGGKLARKLASPEDLATLQAMADKHDTWLLLVTRPLPILAEATVLLCGALDTRWSRLLWTLAIANAAVALTFAALGQQAEQQEWMTIAIVLSIVVPLAATQLVRQRIRSLMQHQERD